MKTMNTLLNIRPFAFGGAALLTADHGRGIEGPGCNGLSVVFQTPEILNSY